MSMKKAVIFGEGFNVKRQVVRQEAFHDQSIKTTVVLLNWFGMFHEEFKQTFETRNVYDFDSREISLTEVMEIVERYSVVVLLGRIAEKRVLSMKGIVPRKMMTKNKVFYVLPHPSGKNRVLNDKAVLLRCKEMCQTITEKLRRKI